MPRCGGNREKMKDSCNSSPSGCAATDAAIFGPNPKSVLTPTKGVHPHTEIDDGQVRIAGQIDRVAN
jgi:hypothetical protein